MIGPGTYDVSGQAVVHIVGSWPAVEVAAYRAGLARLHKAVRVRPNAAAVDGLRHLAAAMVAAGGSRADRVEARALELLIELYDRIVAEVPAEAYGAGGLAAALSRSSVLDEPGSYNHGKGEP